jgi:hypothetical protein
MLVLDGREFFGLLEGFARELILLLYRLLDLSGCDGLLYFYFLFKFLLPHCALAWLNNVKELLLHGLRELVRLPWDLHVHGSVDLNELPFESSLLRLSSRFDSWLLTPHN